mgnify:CR=1 FL=1
MDLLKYLEPMKNLPDRFSNFAFWRGVRKLKDEVVNAFEYIDSWGENIEHNISNVKNINYTKTNSVKCPHTPETLPPSFSAIANTCVVVRGVYDITLPTLPDDFGAVAYASCYLSCMHEGSKLMSPSYATVNFSNGKMHLNSFCTYFTASTALPTSTTFTVEDIFLYYYPTI